MSLGRKNIAINIYSKAHISKDQASKIFESFVQILLLKTEKKTVKIPNFGNFYRRMTPERLGRNPKTKEQFLIKQQNKIFYKSSNTIKHILN